MKDNNYIRAFIIGSSFLVVLPHLFAVANLDETKINYTYKQYSFVAPTYYGLMNMLSLYIAILFQLSSRMRYVLIGTISPLLVSSISYIYQTYTYTKEEWRRYAVGLFLKHFIIWNVIVYTLDTLV